MRKRKRVFLENPYDLELIFESLKIAGEQNMEYIFMDMLIAHLRMDGASDLTEVSHIILTQLKLLKNETIIS